MTSAKRTVEKRCEMKTTVLLPTDQPAHLLMEAMLSERVEGCRGLIENEHLGIAHERPRDRDVLPLAAGQVVPSSKVLPRMVL